MATGRRGEDGGLQVEKAGDLPPVACALPQEQPAASIVVSAECLRAAAEGQEGFVRLSIDEEPQALELSSGGKYALVMAVSGRQNGGSDRRAKPAGSLRSR